MRWAERLTGLYDRKIGVIVRKMASKDGHALILGIYKCILYGKLDFTDVTK